MSEIIESLRIWIEGVVLWLGYAGIALVMFLETVFPPIPSEMVMPFAGLVAADGRLDFGLVVAAATVGSLAGALLLYFLGATIPLARLRSWIGRYGRYALINEADFDRSFRFFERRGDLVVFFGRLIMLVRSLISLPAGVTRMHIPRFLFFTALGAGMWNTGLAAAGYLLGEHWHDVIAAVDYWEEVILLVGAAGVVGLLAGRRILANRSALRQSTLTAGANLRDSEDVEQI